MKRPLSFMILVILLFNCVFSFSSASAQSFGVIFIKADGDIEPVTAPIELTEGVYHLKANLYDTPIIMEKNDAVFNGEGYILEGSGDKVSFNLTCSNVTIVNLQIMNWEVGLLGQYNNNSLNNCSLAGNDKGIAIYADNYSIAGNCISQNELGLRIKGNNIKIHENLIENNSIGIWITSYEGYTGNIVSYNTFELIGQVAVEIDFDGGFEIHHNNFITHDYTAHIVSTPAYHAIPGDETKMVLAPWDNGKEGNYWSNYQTLYPNASEIGNSNVGNIPYIINIAPNITDRYPLIKQIEIKPSYLPTPTSSSSPNENISPNPTISPSSTIPEVSILLITPAILAISMIIIKSFKRIKTNSKEQLVKKV